MEMGSWKWFTIDRISELKLGEEEWVSEVTNKVLS